MRAGISELWTIVAPSFVDPLLKNKYTKQNQQNNNTYNPEQYMIKSQKDLNHEGQDHRSPPATSPQANHEKDSPEASGAARCPPAQPTTRTPLREQNDKVIAQRSPAQPQALSL